MNAEMGVCSGKVRSATKRLRGSPREGPFTEQAADSLGTKAVGRLQEPDRASTRDPFWQQSYQTTSPLLRSLSPIKQTLPNPGQPLPPNLWHQQEMLCGPGIWSRCFAHHGPGRFSQAVGGDGQTSGPRSPLRQRLKDAEYFRPVVACHGGPRSTNGSTAHHGRQ